MRENNIHGDRRNFLKSAIASGTIIGLAGCLGGDDEIERPGLESDVEYEQLPTQRLMTVGRSEGAAEFEQSELLTDMWERLGFNFELDVVDWGLHADKRAELDFETFIVAWTGSLERLYPYYNLYHSFHSDFAYPGGGNFPQWEYAAEQYDEAVENFFQTMDREESANWAKYCQAIIAENIPTMMLTHPDALATANENLYTNWQAMPGRWPFWNISNLAELESTGETNQIIYANQPEFRGFPNIMAVNGGVDWYANTFHYDTLVRLDENGDPTPSAAESWESIDATTIEVTLREDLVFHDGENVTSDDVKFTWDYVTDHGLPYLESDLEPYESSEVVDDRVIQFNLKEAFGGFVEVSLFRVPILPQHIWEGVTEEQGIDHPSQWSDPDTTGSGPFVLDTHDQDQRIIWTIHEDHHLSNEFDFDQLIYEMHGDLTTAIGDVENNNAAFVEGLTPTLYEQHDANHLNRYTQPGIATDGIFMNHTVEPWMDVNVRKALAYATNIEQIINIVFQGYATNATSPISPINETYHNEDAKAYTEDLDEAISLLEESGFRWDDDNNLMKPVDWEPHTTYVSVENEWV